MILRTSVVLQQLGVGGPRGSLAGANERHLHVLPYKTQYWGILSSVVRKLFPPSSPLEHDSRTTCLGISLPGIGVTSHSSLNCSTLHILGLPGQYQPAPVSPFYLTPLAFVVRPSILLCKHVVAIDSAVSHPVCVGLEPPYPFQPLSLLDRPTMILAFSRSLPISYT